MCFWEPDGKGGLFRSARIPDTVKGISRFQQCVLHQGRIESFFLDKISSSSQGKAEVERGILPLSIDIDEKLAASDSEDVYPVTVVLKNLDEEEAQPDQYGGKIANGLFRQFQGDQDKYYSSEGNSAANTEILRAKYVVGCDGAHSWVRKQLGIEMEGESTDYVWGVLDAVPLTNFPDIRHRCAIHSAEHGSIMVIPREHGVVRFYIQLQETPRDPDSKTESEKEAGAEATTKGRVDRSRITPEFILGAAQKIFEPYTIDVRDIRWYTAYQIGQRVSPSWHKNNRVFIAGDACHTHSPKAGQGMNTSMMDTYNLGWKLAWVCKGLADPKILETYEDERRQNAYDLINFDHKLSRLFSGKPHLPGQDDDGVSLEEFRKVFEKGKAFASGCIIDYNPSCLEIKPAEFGKKDEFGDLKYVNPLASKITIGTRFDSAQVLSQSEATPHHLADAMPSDGRFRIVYFAGDFKNNAALTEKMNVLGEYLSSESSFIRKYTPSGAKIDSLIEVLTVHASPRTSVEWFEFPQSLRPKDDCQREDYWKIFVDDDSHHNGHGHAYEKYGIDPSVGAFVVVRPDGYVATVAPLGKEGIEQIAKYFDGFVKVPTKPAEKVAEVDMYGLAEVSLPVLAL